MGSARTSPSGFLAGRSCWRHAGMCYHVRSSGPRAQPDAADRLRPERDGGGSARLARPRRDRQGRYRRSQFRRPGRLGLRGRARRARPQPGGRRHPAARRCSRRYGCATGRIGRAGGRSCNRSGWTNPPSDDCSHRLQAAGRAEPRAATSPITAAPGRRRIALRLAPDGRERRRSAGSSSCSRRVRRAEFEDETPARPGASGRRSRADAC